MQAVLDIDSGEDQLTPSPLAPASPLAPGAPTSP